MTAVDVTGTMTGVDGSVLVHMRAADGVVAPAVPGLQGLDLS